MKRNYSGVLVVLVIMLVAAMSGGLNANANLTSAAGGKPQPQVAAKPSLAEPNPSWQDKYPDYYKVRMAAPTDGWIVGAEGAIRRYAGGQWVAYASPVTTTLHSVYPISNTAFAVGDNNVIMQFSNDAWQLTPSPSGCANFRDLWMVSPSNGWAVGSSCAITPTAVLDHYNGSAWQPTTVPTNTTGLNAVQMISSTEGWAVGNAGTILHYSGGIWQNANSGISSDIYSIAMLPDGSEGWAGYYSPLHIYTIHYRNGMWGGYGIAPRSPQQPADCNPCVSYGYGIAALSSSNRIVVGLDYQRDHLGTTTISSTYASGVGSNNTWNYSDDGAYALQSVYMVASNDAWIAGSDGYIGHYDGTSLTRIEGATFAINTITYNSVRRELYEAGYDNNGDNNIIKVVNNVSGSTVISCTTPNLWLSVATLNSNDLDAWAVGAMGSVAHVTIAGCSTTQLGIEDFDSIAWATPNSAVAVGLNGVLAVFDGAWHMVGHLSAQVLESVSYSGGRYWAVGVGNTIYTTASDPSQLANWQAIPLPHNDYLSAISAVSNTEAWAVGSIGEGNGGAVRYHITGVSSLDRQIETYFMDSIYMLNANEGWAGSGNSGAIEHYSNGAWSLLTNSGPGITSMTFSLSGEGWATGYASTVGYASLQHYAPACYDYYTDVPPDYYAHQYILDLSCRGIVSGMGGHVYAPNANATRIQFATIISLARGWVIGTPSSPTFSDVLPANPLYAFVEAAYANGAISGADAATCTARGLAFPCFLPNDPISRAQAVVITVRAFGWPIDTSGGPHFSDVSPSNFAYGAVETAYNKGVVSGVGGGLFAPNASVTRAQIAKIVDLALTSP